MFHTDPLTKYCHIYQGTISVDKCSQNVGYFKNIIFQFYSIHNSSKNIISYFLHFRRARENKGILKKLQREKLLLRRELFDRVKKGQFLYRPKGEYIPVGFDKVPVIST